jgi:S1-C subfamily serine protease
MPGLRWFLVLVAACLGASVTRPAYAVELSELAARTKPSVVHLSIRDSSGREESSGSGFFVAGGRIITNHHVVDGAHRVVARLEGGRELEVKGALALDPDSDLALLQVEPGSYPPLVVTSARAVRVGQEIVVIGSPVGLSGTLSSGIVSAIRAGGVEAGAEEDLRGSRAWVLQITAPTSPGSSGSPVMTLDGEVIGVAVGMHRGGQALNFAVPGDAVKALLESVPGDATAKPFANVAGTRFGRNLAISGLVVFSMVVSVWIAARVVQRRAGKAPPSSR